LLHFALFGKLAIPQNFGAKVLYHKIKQIFSFKFIFYSLNLYSNSDWTSSAGLHSACGIHGVAKEAITGHCQANNTRNGRTFRMTNDYLTGISPRMVFKPVWNPIRKLTRSEGK
jgi:hypothetical protein